MLWEGQCRVFPIKQNVDVWQTAFRCPLNPHIHRNTGMPFMTKLFRCEHFTGSNAVIKTINMPSMPVPILQTGDFDHQFACHRKRSTVVTKKILHQWTIFKHLYKRCGRKTWRFLSPVILKTVRFSYCTLYKTSRSDIRRAKMKYRPSITTTCTSVYLLRVSNF
jgi:hypothetical protein